MANGFREIGCGRSKDQSAQGDGGGCFEVEIWWEAGEYNRGDKQCHWLKICCV